VYGQTATGLVLALNGMPTSLVVWYMSVCSLNRQNISLDWHRYGRIEGRAMTPGPHLPTALPAGGQGLMMHSGNAPSSPVEIGFTWMQNRDA